MGSRFGLHVAAWESRRQKEIDRRVSSIRRRLKIVGGGRVVARSFDPSAAGAPSGASSGKRRGPAPRAVVSDAGETFATAEAAIEAVGLADTRAIYRAIRTGVNAAGRRWFYADTEAGRAILAGKVVAA